MAVPERVDPGDQHTPDVAVSFALTTPIVGSYFRPRRLCASTDGALAWLVDAFPRLEWDSCKNGTFEHVLRSSPRWRKGLPLCLAP